MSQDSSKKGYKSDLTGAELEALLGGGGGGSALTVREADGTPTGLDISEIVFNGSTGVGGETVMIIGTTAFINGVAPPANLGGDLLLAGTTKYLGRESQSNINYEAAAGASHDYIINDKTFTLTETTFANASIGNLVVSLNGISVANIDLLANFVELNRDGIQNMGDYNTQGTGDPILNGRVIFPGGWLQLNGVHWTSPIGADPYQDGNFTINITDPALLQGYNFIDVSHNGFNNNRFKVFNDIDTGANPSISATAFDVNSLVLKDISGVSYAYTGSVFDLDFIGNDCFDNVYHVSNAPVVMSSTWGVGENILYGDVSVTGVSTPPDINEAMVSTNKPITVPAGHEVPDARISLLPRDPYSNYLTVQTPSNDIMIMSIADASNRVTEHFVDENWRFPLSTNVDILPPLLTGNWNSSNALGATDLQVYDMLSTGSKRSLVHPHDDLTLQIPVGNPDYSILSGGVGKQYLRLFQGIIDNSNGVINIPGISNADLVSGDVILEVKVPTKTVWLNIWTDYTFATFPTNADLAGGIDGTGAKINPGVHSPDIDGSLEFTLGGFASDASVNRVLWFRVTYSNSSIPRVLESAISLSW